MSHLKLVPWFGRFREVLLCECIYIYIHRYMGDELVVAYRRCVGHSPEHIYIYI